MKIVLKIFIFFVLFVPSLYASNGSFLILKSTYLFPLKDQQGRKFLTRNQKAYEVINLYKPPQKSMMFEIKFSKEENIINGSGFIVETEAELKELGIKKVKVYPELPQKSTDLTDYHLVPSNHLSFSGRQLDSPDFPNLTWKAVNFKTNAPIRIWVPEWAGIYRPDKNADWLNKTYESLINKNLDKILLEKILMGLVETGFTKEQVRMALGEPIEEQLIENSTKLEWRYNGRKVIFDNDVVSRVL